MAAYLIVRAVVPEEDRTKFDQWYQDVHLPEALAGTAVDGGGSSNARDVYRS